MKKITNIFTEYFNKYDNYRGKLFLKNEMTLISAKQFYYIDAIKLLKSPNHGQLAEYFGVSRPAVTKIIGKLEEMNYVMRVNSKDDKRFYTLKLTKDGREISKLNFTASEFIVSEIEGRLSANELIILRKLLDKGLR